MDFFWEGFNFNGLKGFNFKVKVNIKVKGFRSPGATYFLFPEKKVGKESGLPGRQGQSRTVLLVVGGFVVGPAVLLASCRYRFG
ncbi:MULTISPECIES: hypothetical protein [Cupriavidus]